MDLDKLEALANHEQNISNKIKTEKNENNNESSHEMNNNQNNHSNTQDVEMNNEKKTITNDVPKIAHTKSRENKYKGVSRTVKIYPITGKCNEMDLYRLVENIAIPLNIAIMNQNKRPCKTQMSFRRAFLQFENTAIVDKVITQLNKTTWMNRTIHVQYNQELPVHYRRNELKDKTKWIYISNIPFYVTNESELKDIILQHCLNKNNKENDSKDEIKIETMWLFHHKNVITNKDHSYKGYAFVEFHTEQAASYAVRQLSLQSVNFLDDENDTRLFVTWRYPRHEFVRNENLKDQAKKIMLCNIHYSANPNEIKAFLQEHHCDEHRTKKIRIFYDNIGYPLGMAWVQYDNVSAANHAFETLHNCLFKGLRIDVGFSKEHEQKKHKKNNEKDVGKEKKKKIVVKNLKTLKKNQPHIKVALHEHKKIHKSTRMNKNVRKTMPRHNYKINKRYQRKYKTNKRNKIKTNKTNNKVFV